jgi:ectoine hydroxylase-related dioxygenase (phytanoyl-CoA dioxygenase family)
LSSQAAPVPFERPFPALTPAQRYHYDVFGYVVIPKVFTKPECERMLGTLRHLREELRSANPQDPMQARVGNARFAINQPHHVYVTNMYEYDPSMRDYVCHPRIVGLAEEIMGCEARITEFNAHLNSRDPAADLSKPPEFGFHHGVDIPFGSHTVNGLYHCNFVKCLTNLTDLGPDDGGTVVVAGSHKVDDYAGAIKAAYDHRTLIHQVAAPAGSVLLFGETLIHATGQIRSDKERGIIIVGFGPRMYPRWDEGENAQFPFSEAFLKKMPESLKTLFLGKAHWTRGQKYRKLTDPVDHKVYKPVPWPD